MNNNPNPNPQEQIEAALLPVEHTAGGATDDELGMAVTWNGSATLNLWTWNGERLDNTDVRTIYGDTAGGPMTVHQANMAAADWLTDIRTACPECGTLGSDRYAEVEWCDACADYDTSTESLPDAEFDDYDH